MLGEDEREKRGLDGVGLAVQIAVAVFATVRVVRSEDDEAALGEAGGEVVIGGGVPLDHVTRQRAPAVLAHDDRTALARLQVPG